MSLKERFQTAFRQEADKLKHMSGKDKLWYIWEYYKYHIIGTATVLFLVISLGSTLYAGRYGTALSCIIVNAWTGEENLYQEEYFQSGFRQFADINEHARIDVDHSLTLSFKDQSGSQMQYATMAKITAMTAAKELDVIIGDPQVIENYGSMGGFLDLKEAFPPELYEAVKDSVYYIADKETGQQIPCGIALDPIEFQEKTGLLIEDPVFAIMNNTTRIDTCIELFRYIVQK